MAFIPLVARHAHGKREKTADTLQECRGRQQAIAFSFFVIAAGVAAAWALI